MNVERGDLGISDLLLLTNVARNVAGPPSISSRLAKYAIRLERHIADQDETARKNMIEIRGAVRETLRAVKAIDWTNEPAQALLEVAQILGEIEHAITLVIEEGR